MHKISHLKRVILRWNLPNEIISNHGHLLQNIVSNLGDLAEEEEGKDSGADSEAGGDGAEAHGAG